MNLQQITLALQQIATWLNWFSKKKEDPNITEPAPPLPVIPPVVTPILPQVTNKPDYLTLMCAAIADYEGGPGDRNHLNCNPGNLRSWPGYPQDHGFAKFPTWEIGMMALETLIKNAAKGISSSYQPNMTLVQFFGKYSPTADGNNPTAYANFVAKRMGVGVSFQLFKLLQ